MRGDSLEAMLNAYKDELTQAAYTPEYRTRMRRLKAAVVKTKSKKKLDDDALLKRLEGLTAPEATTPPAKVGARRK